MVTPITHSGRGFKLVGEWLGKVNGFLDENGIKSVKEIVGRTLPQIRSWDTLVRIPRGEIWAEIDGEKCNRCKLCLQWCFYDAVSERGGVPVIDRERCEGCANCVTLCPKEAIDMRGNNPIYLGDGL